MAWPPHRVLEEELVDETAAASFPASDAPGWSALHAGVPSHRLWLAEHGRELRSSLRADVERLHAATDGEPKRGVLEDLVARAMLDAGRAVMREPVDDALRARNVEAEQLGTLRGAPSVVIAARYDSSDASGTAVLLALVRALSATRTRRTLRFVAFATAAGSARYAARLRMEGASVHSMVSIARLDLSRARGGSGVVFVGNLSSASVARAARDAFHSSSRIRVRAIALPAWVPGVRVSDHAAFWEQGWRAVMVADALPWRLAPRRSSSAPTPDVDQMAAAVPGLAAGVIRLAGGRS
jgi:hypothetical protein